jgi:hypothetical protein
MAQHDYDIANQSGANFRADLNNALDAIVSNNSGSSQPSTTFAYEWWVDTSANLLKLRNSANNAWITLPLSITASNETSGALTVNGNLTTTGTVDVNGQELILDADADTSITADTDDQIDIRVGAVDVLTLTNSHLVLKGTTPKITIGDGGEEDTALIFDGNAQDYYIGLDDSADDLIIGKGSTVGTTPAVVIDENLNVGIGNTPTAVGSYKVLQVTGGSTSNGGLIRLETSDGTSGVARLFAGSTSTVLESNSNTNLVFQTNATERMRIASGGEFLINKTSASGATEGFEFESNVCRITKNGGTPLFLNRLTSDGVLVDLRKDTVQVGTISTNANSLPSDKNFKRDISDLDLGLNLISKLKPSQYNYKIDDEGSPKMFGLIAQDLEESLSEVGIEKNSTWLLQHEPKDDENESDYSLDYLKLTPVLIKAIQEQQTQIEALQSEINTLKGG